jgi:hypothetical protein
VLTKRRKFSEWKVFQNRVTLVPSAGDLDESANSIFVPGVAREHVFSSTDVVSTCVDGHCLHVAANGELCRLSNERSSGRPLPLCPYMDSATLSSRIQGVASQSGAVQLFIPT